jgi:hypothetical protein
MWAATGSREFLRSHSCPVPAVSCSGPEHSLGPGRKVVGPGLAGVMVKGADITQVELDEMVALFDDPTFVDVRSVFISVWGQKPVA